jgi:hypothetical protein
MSADNTKCQNYSLLLFCRASTAGSHFPADLRGKIESFAFCTTGGKFAVAGQQIAGASENFVLNY